MAFDSKGLDDYIDVAQRIADFRERYPNGSLQPADPTRPWEQAVINGYTKQGEPFAATMIVYTAAAYRTPDDQRPGIGVAWEPFPGRTPYTLGSELMNAETSAWGRAIVAALASDSKRGVASREEARNRAAEREEPTAQSPPAPNGKPQRTRAKVPGPEHERLVQPPPDERVNGRPAERTRGPMPDADNIWQDIPTEERPGSATPQQVRGIQMTYQKLGFTKAERAQAIATSEQITGRHLTGPNEGRTHNNLSFVEATKLKDTLDGFGGDRQKLAAVLTAAVPS
jgi:hypothetical protein